MNLKQLIIQFIKFGFVGVFCFLVDYGFLAFFKEIVGFHYILAATLSFSISTVFNYLLSMRFVFTAREDESRVRLFVIYVFLSIAGLGVNIGLMWLGTDVLGINVYIVKLFATAVVTVFNFITRKVFIEK